MRTRIGLVPLLPAVLTLIGMAQTVGAAPPRPKGPCDIYGAAGTPCVAAHSTTRALYASYNGPLYQVKRPSDGKARASQLRHGRDTRDEGRLAILNWRPDALCPPGPPIEHRVSMRSTLCTVERRSWTLVKAGTIGFDGYLLVLETTDESVQS